MARAIDADEFMKEIRKWLGNETDFRSLQEIITGMPTIDSVKQFANELIYRLNNHANRYVGGTCNGRFYPEAELFEVDEVYEIIDRVLDGTPEDTSARMDGE